MDYAELSLALQQYCQSTESSFVANIPTFVTQAENRVYNTVEFPALRKVSTSSLIVGGALQPTPPDFMASFSFLINVNGRWRSLLETDVSWLVEAFPNDLVTGEPRYYAQPNSINFQLAPAPDFAYPVKLDYFYQPTSIVIAGNSWLGDNFPSVLLSGSLIEAYTYLKGETDIMALYTGRYNEAIGMLKNLGEGRNRIDAYRSGFSRARTEA